MTKTTFRYSSSILVEDTHETSCALNFWGWLVIIAISTSPLFRDWLQQELLFVIHLPSWERTRTRRHTTFSAWEVASDPTHLNFLLPSHLFSSGATTDYIACYVLSEDQWFRHEQVCNYLTIEILNTHLRFSLQEGRSSFFPLIFTQTKFNRLRSIRGSKLFNQLIYLIQIVS